MNPLKATVCMFKHHDLRLMAMKIRDGETLWKLHECRRCGRLIRSKPDGGNDDG